MILTFKEKFVLPIIDRTKNNTIRLDEYNRWKVGMKIHFWKDNPRNVKSDPYHFANGIVAQVDSILIVPNSDIIVINRNEYIENEDLERFAFNDGFKSWQDMKTFFPFTFSGNIIRWEKISILTGIELWDKIRKIKK